MPRLTRKRIELNEDSVKDLMQETYNDAHQIRSTIIALFNNWNAKVKEQHDVAGIGKEIVALINSLARNQDQKIALMKVLSDIVFKTDKLNNASKQNDAKGDQKTITGDVQQMIRDMIADQNKLKEDQQED